MKRLVLTVLVLLAGFVPVHAQHEHPPIPPEIWPDAVAVHTVKAGVASDPDVYEGGELPNASTVVIADHDLGIDGTLTVKQLWVRGGTTELLNGAHLHAHGSIVNGSTFKYDKVTANVSIYVPDDRAFTGNDGNDPFPALPDFHPDDIGYWGLPGSSNLMRGIKRALPWCSSVPPPDAPKTLVVKLPSFVDPYGFNVSKLACYTSVAVSGGQVTLDADPADWEVGDELLITDTSNGKTRTTITAVDGRQISFDDQAFVGHAVWYTDWGGEVTLAGAPHVANRTRSVTWDAPLVTDADPNHRPHIVFLHGSHVHFDDNRVDNFGPENKLGRYPVHFHHGEAEHGDSAVANVITGSRTRGLVIHRYNGLDARWTLVDGAKGDAVFMEDLTERNNLVTHTFVTGAKGRAGRDGVLDKGRPGKPTLFAGAPIGGSSHGIWAAAGNTVEDNYQHDCDFALAVMVNETLPAVQPLARRNRSDACQGGPWGSRDFIGVDNDAIYCTVGCRTDISGGTNDRPDIHQDLVRSRYILCGTGPSPYPPYPEFILEDCVQRTLSTLTTETEKFAFFNCDVESLLLVPNPRRFQFSILFDSSRVKIHNQIWNRYEHPFNRLSLLAFANCTGSIAQNGLRGMVVNPANPPVELDGKPYYALAYSNGKLVDGPFVLTDEFRPTILAEPLPPGGMIHLEGKLPTVDVGGKQQFVNEYAVVRKGVTTEIAWDAITNFTHLQKGRFGLDHFEHNGYFGFPPGEYEFRFRHSANTAVEVVKDLVIESYKVTTLSFP